MPRRFDMRLLEWLLLLLAAVLLPVTLQAVFARRSRGRRPQSRHAERYLTARFAEDRRPGFPARPAEPGPAGASERTALHERESGV